MSLNLQSFRNMQKPLLFGLAVFLMIAFGVPWQDWFGRTAMRGQMTGKEPYMQIDDRKYSLEEWNDFAFRWRALVVGDKKDADAQLQRSFMLLQEARHAGLQVPPEQLRQAVRTFPMLRRSVAVEIVQAKPDAFKEKATVTPEQIEAYYNEHKEDYRLPAEKPADNAAAEKPAEEAAEAPAEKDAEAAEAPDEGAEAPADQPAEAAEAPAKEPAEAAEAPAEQPAKEEAKAPEAPQYKDLQDVSDSIKAILVEKEAAKLADEALASAKKQAENAGKNTYKALNDAAQSLGLEYSEKDFEDEENAARGKLGVFASNEDLLKKCFTDPIGVVRGPYKADAGPYIFRVALRTAGFDANKKFQAKYEGWVPATSSYGTVDDKVDYDKFLASTIGRVTPDGFEKTVRESLLINRYQELVGKLACTPADTAEQSYLSSGEKARISALSFDAATFSNTVGKLSDKDLEEFYNKYKDKEQTSPASGERLPGYLQPASVTIEYVLAAKPDLASAGITDNEVTEYYNQNQKSYVKDPDAKEPEYLPLDDTLKERVKSDIIQERFDKKVDALSELIQEAETRLLAGGESDMGKLAAEKGLKHETNKVVSDNGRGFYNLGVDFMQDQDEVLKNLFDPNYLTAADLKAGKTAESDVVRKNVISRPLKLRSGSQYCFRVIERKEAEEVEFSKIAPEVRYQVDQDLRTQRALDRAVKEAAKFASLVRADAFNLLAEELGVTPQVTGEFKAGEQPAEFPAGSAVGKAAAALKPGEMSGIIQDGDNLSVALCNGTKAELTWSVITFPKDKALAGPEPSDDDLAAYLDKNVESFADVMPLKGGAQIGYVAAINRDIEATITPTDDEVKAFYEKNKDEKFGGKALDECKDDVVAAIKAEKAVARGAELLKKAYEDAKKDEDKRLDEIVKDTPLTQMSWQYVNLEKPADAKVVGKAPNLARLILATKVGELAGPVTTDEGSFFFRLDGRYLGDMSKTWADLPEEVKEKVKTAMAADEAKAKRTPAENARLQLARYVEAAMAKAPEAHLMALPEKVKAGVSADRHVSYSNSSALSVDSIRKLAELQPGTVSDPIVEGSQVILLHPVSKQPMDMAKVEYFRLGPESFSQTNDWQRDQREGAKLLEVALPKVAAAAKNAESVQALIKAVEADVKTVQPLMVGEKWITRADPQLGGAFDLEPGKVGELNVGNASYFAKVLETKPCMEAKAKFVQVFADDFLSADVAKEQAPAVAEEAMKAFRETAVADGMDKAFEEIKKKVTSQREMKVTDSARYFNQATGLLGVPGRKALEEAIFAAKPGDITEVVRDGSAFSVAQVEDVQSEGYTVDIVRLTDRAFSDPNSITKEELQNYYDAHKEDFRRDKSAKIEYISTSSEDYRSEAEKAATKEAVEKYFEEHKAKWQTPGADGKMVDAKLENIKQMVKTEFVTEQMKREAYDALTAVRKDMAAQDADLAKLATEKLHYNALDLLTYKQMENRIAGISNLPEIAARMKKGDVSEVVGMGPEFYLLKTTDEKESHIPDLKEVENDVRTKADAALQSGRAEEAAKTLKADIEKAMAAGKKFTEAADTVTFTKHGKATYETPARAFARGTPNVFADRRKTPKLVKAAFSLERGCIGGPIREDNEQKAVELLVVREIVKPDPLTEKKLKDQQRYIESVVRQAMIESHVNQLVGRTKFLVPMGGQN